MATGHSHQGLQENCSQKDLALNTVGRSSSLSLKAGGFESNPCLKRAGGCGPWRPPDWMHGCIDGSRRMHAWPSGSYGCNLSPLQGGVWGNEFQVE